MKIKHKRGERGTQLLEFALVAPVLILLTVIIVEFAGAWRLHQVLNNAAREGARLSSLKEHRCTNDPTCSGNPAIRDAVLDYLCRNKVANSSCGGSGPSVTITINQSVPVSVGVVTVDTTVVTVSRPYPLPMGSFFSNTPSSIMLQGSAQFRLID
jgi:Flp pilus assembly protein TadG